MQKQQVPFLSQSVSLCHLCWKMTKRNVIAESPSSTQQGSEGWICMIAQYMARHPFVIYIYGALTMCLRGSVLGTKESEN